MHAQSGRPDFLWHARAGLVSARLGAWGGRSTPGGSSICGFLRMKRIFKGYNAVKILISSKDKLTSFKSRFWVCCSIGKYSSRLETRCEEQVLSEPR